MQMPELAEWDSFYVIVGSSAGALIGLQFVVMTLIADRPQLSEAGRAFATPTVVHFGACLLASALMQVPWPGVTGVAWAVGAVGASGLIYMAGPVQRMRRQRAYQMDWEDWTFHVYVPFAAYALLILSGVLGLIHSQATLFGVAGAALMLLFDGIHNAWDSVQYQVFMVPRKKPDEP
jgi:hypothetical protein